MSAITKEQVHNYLDYIINHLKSEEFKHLNKKQFKLSYYIIQVFRNNVDKGKFTTEHYNKLSEILNYYRNHKEDKSLRRFNNLAQYLRKEKFKNLK